MSKDYTYDLFVSYADADRAWVKGYLLDALKSAGIRYVSEATGGRGAFRAAEFRRALDGSAHTLLVLSPAYTAAGSEAILDLLAAGYGNDPATWPVIPLVLQAVPVPGRLAGLPRLNATDPGQWPAVLERLCDDLGHGPPVPSAVPPCPYPGLRAFTAADAPVFYGRDAEIATMLGALQAGRSLFVIGPARSGKTSLLAAGLLPALAAGQERPAGYWLVRQVEAGSPPLAALRAALGGDAAAPGPALDALLRTNKPAGRLLLVVDGGEQALAGGGENAAFLAALQALRADERCALVLALRAEAYPDLLNSVLWPVDPQERLDIAAPRDAALRQAIEGPAADAGVYVEPALIARLVQDAGTGAGALGLLQATLVQLWGQMERHLLPLSAYSRLADGGRSGLGVAFARYADEALAALPTGDGPAARRILARLSGAGGPSPDGARPQPVAAVRPPGVDPAGAARGAGDRGPPPGAAGGRSGGKRRGSIGPGSRRRRLAGKRTLAG